MAILSLSRIISLLVLICIICLSSFNGAVYAQDSSMTLYDLRSATNDTYFMFSGTISTKKHFYAQDGIVLNVIGSFPYDATIHYRMYDQTTGHTVVTVSKVLQRYTNRLEIAHLPWSVEPSQPSYKYILIIDFGTQRVPLPPPDYTGLRIAEIKLRYNGNFVSASASGPVYAFTPLARSVKTVSPCTKVDGKYKCQLSAQIQHLTTNFDKLEIGLIGESSFLFDKSKYKYKCNINGSTVEAKTTTLVYTQLIVLSIPYNFQYSQDYIIECSELPIVTSIEPNSKDNDTMISRFAFTGIDSKTDPGHEYFTSSLSLLEYKYE